MDAAWTGHTSLVGRSGELDDLDEVLASVSAGAGAIVLLEGEAGIGKSAVVRAVRASAQLLGLAVRAASARPGDRPFAIFADALLPDDGTAPGAGAGPGLARGAAADADADPGTLTEERAVELVRRLGGREPCLLVLEDLHSADDDSLGVLRRLAREGVASGVLVLATLRPVPRRSELADVVTAWTRAGARYVELRPLTASASLELARQELGARPGPSLRGSIATAGGNPTFVLDIVGAARTALVPDGVGGADVVDQAWTAALDAVLAHRLDYLGPQVVGLLERASVLGTSFVVGDLAELADEPVAECWRVLRHALAAGVVHARGDRLVFRHDVVRSALYAGLEAQERGVLHERAARTLARAGAPTAVVQTHRDLAR